MNLNGGIDQYSFTGERYKDQKPPKGRKVRFLNENGYDGDLEYAREFFNEGDELEVNEIYVERSNSTVEFIGFEGKLFNTVLFEDI